MRRLLLAGVSLAALAAAISPSASPGQAMLPGATITQPIVATRVGGGGPPTALVYVGTESADLLAVDASAGRDGFIFVAAWRNSGDGQPLALRAGG